MQWNFLNVSPVLGLPNPETLEIAQGDGFSHQVLPWELRTRVVGQFVFVFVSNNSGSPWPFERAVEFLE